MAGKPRARRGLEGIKEGASRPDEDGAAGEARGVYSSPCAMDLDPALADRQGEPGDARPPQPTAAARAAAASRGDR